MIAEPIPWPPHWHLVSQGKVLASGDFGDVLRELYQLPPEKRTKAELRVGARRSKP